MNQQPDSKPGAYYVSVIRGDGDWRPLLGPFINDHAKALALVDKARAKAEELDARAVWYSFGTVRVPLSEPAEFKRPGIITGYFKEELQCA